MTSDIQKLYDLNEDFYKSFARLKKNAEFLTDKQYKSMADALTAKYQKEVKLLTMESDLDYKRNIFILKRLIKRKVPFAWLFFHNREGKLILEEIDKDYNLLTESKENTLKKDSKNDN